MSPGPGRSRCQNLQVVATLSAATATACSSTSRSSRSPRAAGVVHDGRRQDLEGRLQGLREGRRGDADGEAPRDRVQGHRGPAREAGRAEAPTTPGTTPLRRPHRPPLRRRRRGSDHEACRASRDAPPRACERLGDRCARCQEPADVVRDRGTRAREQHAAAEPDEHADGAAPARRRAGRVLDRRLRHRFARSVRSRRQDDGTGQRDRDVLSRRVAVPQRRSRRRAQLLPRPRQVEQRRRAATTSRRCCASSRSRSSRRRSRRARASADATLGSAACAPAVPYVQGKWAFSQGKYDDALGLFAQVAAGLGLRAASRVLHGHRARREA